MASFTTSNTFTELSPNSGYKDIIVTSPATGISGDTLVVTLPDHGISAAGFLTIDGTIETTAGSVVSKEAPTTTVSAGVLTITSGAGTGAKSYRILGKSN